MIKEAQSKQIIPSTMSIAIGLWLRLRKRGEQEIADIILRQINVLTIRKSWPGQQSSPAQAECKPEDRNQV